MAPLLQFIKCQLTCILICCFLNTQFIVNGFKMKRKPIMFGEHLNPNDYENGLALVINETLGNEATVDDGTYNDIIRRKHKKSKLRLYQPPIITPWKDATIPYLLDSQFSEVDRAQISKAVDMITSTTCVKLVPRTTQENYVMTTKNPGSECFSTIGVMGGEQELAIAQRCLDKIGSTTHEFMHCLGFEHEHTRTDRDDYVVIHYENIYEGREVSYEKAASPIISNQITEYDLHSITSYSVLGNSKNQLHTMDPKHGTGTLGQRTKLTEIDIKKVNAFYKCPGNSESNNLRHSNGINKVELAATESPTLESRNESEASQEKAMSLFGPCKDFDKKHCKLWAKHGYCKKSPIFMPFYCKKSCKKCDMVCNDMNKKCPIWAAKDYCEKFEIYMTHYCAASCGKCHIPFVPIPLPIGT